MEDLKWRYSSTFSNNKQSHHDAIATVKDYPCVSQLHNIFQTFYYFSIFAPWLILDENNWWNLDCAYNS